MKILSFLSIYLLVLSLSFAEENAPATADTKPEQPKPKSVVIKPTGEFKYKLIPLKSIDFAIVDKICRPLLSKDGILTFEEKRGSILVGDYPENIEKIMKFLGDIDTDAVNIRIDVDFLNTGSSGGENLDVRVGYGKGIQPNQVIIVDGKVVKPKSIDISASKTSGGETRNTSQFIVTKSGFPASLFVGRTIADPSWLYNYKFLPPTVVVGGGSSVIIPASIPGFVMRDVGAKLMVLPKLRDDGLIEVEIYPEVSYIDGKGAKSSVRVESIVTKLTVQDGQKIYIGGAVSSNMNFYKSLFGPTLLSSDGKSNVLDMYLKASVMKPGKKAAELPPGTDPHSLENPYKWR
ncbi:MAG TPA: hypothetical protein DET40_19445 [Lentisphaeria bacterium]|nr:MAG: hypothetical protein A2X45_18275 [Lentisphaerae bacterium GWF2_50_93]HCE45723.1 hypothetical protein [Lentisphaeria bacterium]